jgi:molybdate transport repressor ModE-like protein
MKIGALIVTTGLSRVSGVTALLPEIGAISAGQRMISVFRCAGISMIGLVVGPEDKKAERQFAQSGVVFLRCKKNATFLDGVREGLRSMVQKFDRVFVVPGDTPLFLPDTLRRLLDSQASIAVPVSNHISGCPVLLDKPAMQALLEEDSASSLETAIEIASLTKEYIPVSDSGIFLRGPDMSHKQELIARQSHQLSRPIAEVAICNGSPLYDSRLAMLLHLVEDTRSVQDACSLMQISYSTAWKMLNHVEEELGFPLVVRNRGGASGNGTLLTEKGKAFMQAYDQFSEHLNQEAQRLYTRLFDRPEWN